MRILFVIKSLCLAGGGAERVLSQIASGLAERGQQVEIASFDGPEGTDFYPIHPAIIRHRLAIGNTSAESRAIETVRKICALRALLVRRKPAIAIGFMHSAYLPLGLAGLGLATPIVGSEHIVFDHYRTRPLQRALLNLAPKLCTKITAISELVRDSFPADIRRRMVIIPNPVILDAGGQADPAGGARKTLLTVGRLADQKDHRTLIEAFAQVADEFPDWNLRIVGEGDLRVPLEQQIACLNLAGRVELPGIRREIGEEYRSAQLFVMPSLYESFGLATAEALGYGLPTLGFARCMGTNELIEHGRNGLLVDGDDRSVALAEGLRRLMGDAKLRSRLALQGPSSVARFSLDRIVLQWESLVQQTAVTSGSLPAPQGDSSLPERSKGTRGKSTTRKEA